MLIGFDAPTAGPLSTAENLTKIVVGGDYYADFTLVRFTTTGMADNTFGTKGIVTTNFSGSGGSKSGDIAYALAVQADGKLVLAGRTSTGANLDIALARYETNGNLDDGGG